MGQRGPIPTPTSILKFRGSRRAKRAGEPQPKQTRPRCPNWLSKEAKVVWRQLLPKLAKMRVLAEVDGNALARYCQLWIRWRKASDFLEEKGEVYPLKDSKGKVKYVQQFPQVAIVNKLGLQLLRIEQEFGLTPSARARLHVSGEEPSSGVRARKRAV